MTLAQTDLANPHASVSITDRPVRTFVAIMLAHVLIDCYGGVWPIFKKLAELDLAWAGLISTVATMTTMSLQPLIGIWADQGRRRFYILLGTTMGCAGMLLGPLGVYQHALGVVPAYAMMFCLLLIVRLGQTLFHPPAAGVAGNAIEGKRSMLVAIFVSGGMIGFASSQSLFSIAYERLDGHTFWLLLPAIPLLLITYAWCRPLENQTRTRRSWGDVAEALGLLKTRMVVLYLILVMISGQMMGLFFLLPELLETKGYPIWLVHGGGFGLMIGGGVLLMVPVGHLADRIGRRRMLAATLALSIVSYYLVVCLPAMPIGIFVVFCLVTGGIIGTANPLGVALGQSLLPHKASLVSGLLMGLAWSGAGPAQWTVGYLASRPDVGIERALMFLGIAGVVALLLCVLLPKASHFSKYDETPCSN